MTPTPQLDVLRLSAGPRLTVKAWQQEAAGPSRPRKRGYWIDVDVTSLALEFLMRPVQLEGGVTLGDVLALLSTDPVLRSVFRREYAQELCDEASLGAHAPENASGPLSIEYLELRQEWQFNSATGQYRRDPVFSLIGVGPAAPEDFVQEDGAVCRKGERIEWSLSLSPLRELLALPLRVKPTIEVREADLDSRRYGTVVREESGTDLTLGELLRSVCCDLSVFGSPRETGEMAQLLKSRLDSVQLEVQQGVQDGAEPACAGKSLQDVFEQLGFAPRSQTYAKFIDNLAELEEEALAGALRELDDGAPAQVGLEQALGRPVRLKAPWAALTGRLLRKAIRESRERGMPAA